MDWLEHEQRLWEQGIRLVAGLDEVGRGPLAGPVVAAAVILRPYCDLPGVYDSKEMTARQRDHAVQIIRAGAVAIGVGAASARTIDRLGIVPATMAAFKQALKRLNPQPCYALVDGNRIPQDLPCPALAIIDGDAQCRSIAAASVVAKVMRDRLMLKLNICHPRYGFGAHKGYGTAAHLEALQRFGPSPHHRFSFEPVRQLSLKIDRARA